MTASRKITDSREMSQVSLIVGARLLKERGTFERLPLHIKNISSINLR